MGKPDHYGRGRTFNLPSSLLEASLSQSSYHQPMGTNPQATPLRQPIGVLQITLCISPLPSRRASPQINEPVSTLGKGTANAFPKGQINHWMVSHRRHRQILANKPPIYPEQQLFTHQWIPFVKVAGSSRLPKGTPYLHGESNFIGADLETVRRSWLHSCRTAINGRGTSLPSDSQG